MQKMGVRAARRWDRLAMVGLMGWLLFDLVSRSLLGAVPWPQSVVDYRIMYDASQRVVATHSYPGFYPYPPPAVALQAATAVFPFPVSASFWLALTGVAAGACYLTLARILGLQYRPGSLGLLLLAHAAVATYFQWDLRSMNCNTIVLATVLFGCAALVAKRDRAAGFWFALAIALKVYPVLLLPYLAWVRRWRAFGWAAGFSIVLWLIVPAVLFGPTAWRDVYHSWFGELSGTMDPELMHSHPILISLHKAATHVAGGDAAAKAIVLSVAALWIFVGLAGAFACWGGRECDGARILTHVSLLIVGPVAMSPYLEMYHLVPLVVPAVVLLAVAADSARFTRVRVVSAIGFLMGLAIMIASSPWPLRGFGVNAQALVLCITAVWATWERSNLPVLPETQTSNGLGGRQIAALTKRLARGLRIGKSTSVVNSLLGS
jgi:hypothetical protein